MIAHLAASIAGIARGDAVYVGDRSEDGESADANQLAFIAATAGAMAAWRRRDGAALARGGQPGGA